MSTEYERRWLVKELPPLIGAGTRIVQGYLAIGMGGVEVRLRSKGGGASDQALFSTPPPIHPRWVCLKASGYLRP
jgi:hypothetical protein